MTYSINDLFYCSYYSNDRNFYLIDMIAPSYNATLPLSLESNLLFVKLLPDEEQLLSTAYIKIYNHR